MREMIRMLRELQVNVGIRCVWELHLCIINEIDWRIKLQVNSFLQFKGHLVVNHLSLIFVLVQANMFEEFVSSLWKLDNDYFEKSVQHQKIVKIPARIQLTYSIRRKHSKSSKHHRPIQRVKRAASNHRKYHEKYCDDTKITIIIICF